ncbi:hypothetical protein ABT095_04950 [Kitasatospora sp. NPDC002227]|uniref:hypothetical protein n=1 Tax=Kitasatospora sp. NPDC002227 TaxID=3154773 RepID=UPI00331C65F1
MTATIATVALGSAAALPGLVYVARQLESTVPAVTSLIKTLIDARREIADHYARATTPKPADHHEPAV